MELTYIVKTRQPVADLWFFAESITAYTLVHRLQKFKIIRLTVVSDPMHC